MSNRDFTLYTVSGFDNSLEYLPLVRDVLYQLSGEEPTPFEGHAPGNPFDLNPRLIHQFMEDWTAARKLAGDAGAPLHRLELTRVFWVPMMREFRYGFVLRELESDTAYVVSPVALPHLESEL